MKANWLNSRGQNLPGYSGPETRENILAALAPIGRGTQSGILRKPKIRVEWGDSLERTEVQHNTKPRWGEKLLTQDNRLITRGGGKLFIGRKNGVSN